MCKKVRNWEIEGKVLTKVMNRNHLVRRLVCSLTMLFLVGIGLASCGQQPSPIPSLWGIPIVSPTPFPLPSPTATPVLKPAIIVTAQSREADAKVRFILNVIVEDQFGRLLVASINIFWSDEHPPLKIGSSSDIKIPIRADLSPFILVVSKPGYRTVRQPFNVSISEDVEYELIVTLERLGDSA